MPCGVSWDRSTMDGTIRFRRLTGIEPEHIIELMNDPRVRRHLPLARGHFGPNDCARFVQSKELAKRPSDRGVPRACAA